MATQPDPYTMALDDGGALMEEPEAPKPWGKLVSSNPKYPNVDLFDSEVTIGRNETNTVTIAIGTISGTHCRIERKDADVVWIYDTSTNGTTIGSEKNPPLGKGNKKLLLHEEEIVLLKSARKPPREKISYVFYSCSPDTEDNLPTTGLRAKYDVRDKLGSGAFATVYLAIDRNSGERFAVKIIEKKKFAMTHGTSRSDALMDEVNILKRLDHKHIIKIFDVFDEAKELSIVLELVQGGDLFDRVIEGPYSEAEARDLFEQMLHALIYLHSNNIVHRDLKPENILMKNKRGQPNLIKLSDFGLSRLVGEGSFMKTLCGTPQYFAPEVLSESKQGATGYTKAVDMWSMGVILYILLSGSPPFDDQDEKVPLFEQVKNAMYKFPKSMWKGISPTAIQLIKQMLTVDPAQRITPEETLEHPWMQGIARVSKGAGPPTKRRKKNGVAMAVDGDAEELDADGVDDDDEFDSSNPKRKRKAVASCAF